MTKDEARFAGSVIGTAAFVVALIGSGYVAKKMEERKAVKTVKNETTK